MDMCRQPLTGSELGLDQDGPTLTQTPPDPSTAALASLAVYVRVGVSTFGSTPRRDCTLSSVRTSVLVSVVRVLLAASILRHPGPGY